MFILKDLIPGILVTVSGGNSWVRGWVPRRMRSRRGRLRFGSGFRVKATFSLILGIFRRSSQLYLSRKKRKGNEHSIDKSVVISLKLPEFFS